MNYSFPRESYLSTDIKSKVEYDDPHSIIVEVLSDLKNSLSTLSYSLEHEDGVSDIKSKSFARSLTAINILQSSLDFEKGGDVAKNLFSIYEFCRKSVLEGFGKKDFKRIQALPPLIDEILDGWKQIKNPSKT